MNKHILVEIIKHQADYPMGLAPIALSTPHGIIKYWAKKNKRRRLIPGLIPINQVLNKKHLPGQHNQKLHSKKRRPVPNLRGALLQSCASLAESKGLWTVRLNDTLHVLCPPDDHSRAAIVLNPVAGNFSVDDDAIPAADASKIADFLSDVEQSIKTDVRLMLGSMTFSLAGHLGYEFIAPGFSKFATSTKDEIRGITNDAIQYLADTYDLGYSGMTMTPVDYDIIADEVMANPLVSNMAKISHPLYPGVSLFTEYLDKRNRNYWKQI